MCCINLYYSLAKTTNRKIKKGRLREEKNKMIGGRSLVSCSHVGQQLQEKRLINKAVHDRNDDEMCTVAPQW